MWWGGFLICGACLLLISIPFFFYPKELKVRPKFISFNLIAVQLFRKEIHKKSS